MGNDFNNISLIIAAPDLLKAAKSTLACLRMCGVAGEMDELKAAIRKAETPFNVESILSRITK